MHYVTHRSHYMQKLKFGVTCPVMLIMETPPDPPEHEIECLDVSRPRLTGMHYVTQRSHWMQNHEFSVTCPAALFMETASGPPKH
jgi:hypothetical protein